MKEKHDGRIINVSSIAAISPPAPDIHHSSAKALGLTLSLALEPASSNICVNAILPAGIRTEMLDQLVPPGTDKDEFYRELGKVIQSLERMGTPEDTAGVALFLASSLFGCVTGDRIIDRRNVSVKKDGVMREKEINIQDR